MSFSQFAQQQQRRLILEQLEAENDYTSNSILLKQILQMLGHTLSSDQVVTEITWLQEQGLVTLESFGGIYVAKLTERGLDVATGAAQIPGIARKGL